MSIILKHIFRNLLKNRFSGILIIISLALCTATIYLNLNINNDLIAISTELFDGMYGGYDVTVSDGSSGELTLDADAFGSDEVLAIRYEIGVYRSETAAAALLIETDWNAVEARSIVSAAEGATSADRLQVGITEKDAAYYRLHLGDRIEIADGRGTTEYTVAVIYASTGMFEDQKLETLIEQGDLLERAGLTEDFLEMSDRGDEISDLRSLISFLDEWGFSAHKLCIELFVPDADMHTASTVFVDSAGDPEATVERLEKAHPEWDVSLTDDMMYADRHLSAIRRILYLMIALTGILGFYVISSVSTLMMDARLPVIATFRSIGASRRKMDLLLLAENAVYGLVGGVLGILIGGLMRYLLAALYYDAADVHRAVSALYVLASLGFSLLLQTGITLYTSARAGRRSIRENIFRTAAVAAETSVPATALGAVMLAAGAVLHLTNRDYGFYRNVAALGLSIVGSALLIPFLLGLVSGAAARRAMKRSRGPLYLALRNLGTSRIDISSVILTAMVVALSMVIFLCAASVSSFFEAYAATYPFDVFIKGMDYPAEAYAFIDDIPGVESSSFNYWDSQTLLLDSQKIKVCFVRRKGYSGGITAAPGAEAALQDGHVLVDAILAARLGIRDGDRIRFDFPDGEQESYTMIADGWCDSGAFNSRRACILMTERDYDRYVENCPARIGVFLQDPARKDDVISDLSTRIYLETGETVRIYSKDAYLADELGRAEGALAVFSVVPALAMTLAALGLVNNQIIAYNRKRREYAVLYSVAMDRAQLGAMIFLELAAVFLAGSVCGIVLSLWLVRIVQDIVYGLVAYVEITYNVPGIALLLLAAFAALCATALIPRRMVSKINVIEEIKYE